MSITMVRRAETTAAGCETMLRGAVQTNLGTMGQFGGTLSDADFRDLAAYLVSPGICARTSGRRRVLADRPEHRLDRPSARRPKPGAGSARLLLCAARPTARLRSA